MKVFAGDELGLLRAIKLRMNVADETPDKKPEEQHDDAEEAKQTKRARKPAIEMERWGRPDRSRATCHITWADAPQLDWTSETSLLVVGRKDGSIEFRSSESGDLLKTYHEDNVAKQPGNDSIVGLWSGADRLATCTATGCIQYRTLNDSDDQDTMVRALVPAPVSVMRVHPTATHLFATGGKDQNLAIWDINRMDDHRPASVHKAKNRPNDFLDMTRPIWINDLAFMNREDPSCIALVTAHHEVQMYDFRQRRRPVICAEIGNRSLTVLTPSANNNEIYCADNYSGMYCVDIRTGKLSCSFKGFAGAVTSIQCTEQHLVTASLDRHLRVHETSGQRRLLKKVYLKQRLSQIVLDHNELDMDEDQPREEEEDDAMWDSMSVAELANRRKKRAL